MVGPWIHALFGRKKRLSDIEYLAIKEFDGKMVKNGSIRTTTGDIATLTASSGKDMYLAKAVIVADGVGTSLDTIRVDLKINGTTEEIFSGEMISGQGVVPFHFGLTGVKVAATEIIKLELITIDSNAIAVAGMIECFEETTGESPQV